MVDVLEGKAVGGAVGVPRLEPVCVLVGEGEEETFSVLVEVKREVGEEEREVEGDAKEDTLGTAVVEPVGPRVSLGVLEADPLPSTAEYVGVGEFEGLRRAEAEDERQSVVLLVCVRVTVGETVPVGVRVPPVKAVGEGVILAVLEIRGETLLLELVVAH